MQEIQILEEPTELYKILKFESLVNSGGEAKAVIDDGQVMVNNEIETRRRKKIIAGDIIDFMDKKYKVVLKQK
ncbi:RNA-binding S4 domain-containing protein [Neptunicella sp.]|uniref:RNA-binding S4 domain-containing protein n=1 Tax=Neptunicella sp. TaxID=2125986 RepID=UPI003F68E845